MDRTKHQFELKNRHHFFMVDCGMDLVTILEQVKHQAEQAEHQETEEEVAGIHIIPRQCRQRRQHGHAVIRWSSGLPTSSTRKWRSTTATTTTASAAEICGGRRSRIT